MLNDVLSLCVGLWAVKVANGKSSSKMYTYGWQRAETLGALINGVFLVALCLSIFLDAIQRFVEPQVVSNPRLVLIVGCFGLLSNILGLFLFHEHGHSHGGGHGHGHAHEEGNDMGVAEQGHSNAKLTKGNGHTETVADESGNVADVLPQNTIAGWPKTTGPFSGINGSAKNTSLLYSKHDEDVNTATMSTSPASARKSVSGTPRHRRHTSGGSRSRFASVDEMHIHPASFRNDIIKAGRLEDIESGTSEVEDNEEALVDEEATEDEPLLGRRKSNGFANGSTNDSAKPKSYDHADHKHSQPKEHGKGGHSHGDLNMRGVFLHVMGDALGNIGVIGSALIIWLTSWSWRYYADPAISLVITVIILGSAIPLCKAASRILLQAVPPGISVDDIKTDIEELPEIISCHHLHVWQLSDTKMVASLHIQLGLFDAACTSMEFTHLRFSQSSVLTVLIGIHQVMHRKAKTTTPTVRTRGNQDRKAPAKGVAELAVFAVSQMLVSWSVAMSVGRRDNAVHRMLLTIDLLKIIVSRGDVNYRDLPWFVFLYDFVQRHIFRQLTTLLRAFLPGTQQQVGQTGRVKWQLKSLINLPTALTLSWMFVIWWGEIGIFTRSVRDCDWASWEEWPESATPHHMVLVADPQLVDPHTYPGRPWPLSAVTRYHTDYYMRKSFTLIQNHLDPTTVFFLGDLFDGGREWMPSGTASSDPRWRRYGEDFWVNEYIRFGNIFFNEWLRRGVEGQHADVHRKIFAGLPGNHDLGLGNGIRIPVKKRFNAFLGEGNHIDVIGNHTFVSLDTVSLSAKGQSDPATGRQGAADGEGSNKEIWGPVDDFLATVKEEKRRVIDRAVRFQNSRIENSLLFHSLLDIHDPLVTKSVHTAFTPKADMPSVLLTHVPLYRAAGTPCGPLRERSPPSTPPTEDGEYLENDPRNAIKVEAGIQYQNVLTPEISNEIIDKVGDVEFAFSGDDHDYCDVVHRRYTGPRGGVREITVKSFSWAMGVRKPGFLMLSLWNPVDVRDRGSTHATTAPGDRSGGTGKDQRHETIQTHLCLLPDQLSIFIRYAVLFVGTLVAVFVHTLRAGDWGSVKLGANGDVLPLSSSSSSTKPKLKSDTPPPSPARRTHHSHQDRGSTAVRPRGYGYGYSPGESHKGVMMDSSSLHDDVLDERWANVSIGEGHGYRSFVGEKG
ncbi:MAG: hypothetical protein Q9216_006572, partial [Gyalolechia sp. 2 TL-2023]